MENQKNSLDINRVFKANKKDKLITALIITAFVVVVVALFSVLRGTTEIGTPLESDPSTIGFMTVNYFNLIFGGFVGGGGIFTANKEGTTGLNFCANTMLLIGFCLAVVALILLILVFLSHKTLLLNKKAYVTVISIAALFFVAAGVLFIFKETAVRNQISNTVLKLYPEYSKEIVVEMLKDLRFSIDAPTILFVGGQFIAAASLIGVLVAENKMKY